MLARDRENSPFSGEWSCYNPFLYFFFLLGFRIYMHMCLVCFQALGARIQTLQATMWDPAPLTIRPWGYPLDF